jgi:hypothetical protein
VPGRRRLLLEQLERLFYQREPGVRVVQPAQVPGTLADDRGDGVVRVAGEPPVRLLRQLASVLGVAC